MHLGFINADRRAKHVVVDYSQIQVGGFCSLEENQRVEFGVTQGAKGPHTVGVTAVWRFGTKISGPDLVLSCFVAGRARWLTSEVFGARIVLTIRYRALFYLNSLDFGRRHL
jgi:cold shock protein